MITGEEWVEAGVVSSALTLFAFLPQDDTTFRRQSHNLELYTALQVPTRLFVINFSVCGILL